MFRSGKGRRTRVSGRTKHKTDLAAAQKGIPTEGGAAAPHKKGQTNNSQRMKQQRKAYYSLGYLSRFACCLSTVSHFPFPISHFPFPWPDLLSYFIILFFALSRTLYSIPSVLLYFFFGSHVFALPFFLFPRFCTYNFSRFPANAAQKFLVVTFNFMPFNSLKAERVKGAKNRQLKKGEYCNYARLSVVCVCRAQRNLPQDTLYSKSCFLFSIWRLSCAFFARPSIKKWPTRGIS